MVESSWRPSHGSSAQQMKMQVKDALSCSGTAVDDHAVAALAQLVLPRQSIRKVKGSAQQGCVRVGCVCKRGDVLYWNDQYMRRGLGVNVFYREQAVCFCDNVRGEQTASDFAEEAGRIVHGHILCWGGWRFFCFLCLSRLLLVRGPTALLAVVLPIAIVPLLVIEPLAARGASSRTITDPHAQPPQMVRLMN